jgi:hypothetical protein
MRHLKIGDALSEAQNSQRQPLLSEMLSRRAVTQEALDRANRTALLEHARMGRSIPTMRDGQAVWIPPAEVFAMYGLDEFGREKQPEQ